MNKGGTRCKKINNPKYKNRPSPPYHAQDCKGKVLLGNDNKYYLSKSNNRGVYRWVKLSYKNNPWQYYAQFDNIPKPKYSVKLTLKKLMKLRKELYKNKIYMPILNWKKHSIQQIMLIWKLKKY